VRSLDAQGRWVKDNEISIKDFSRNISTLARFVAAARGRQISNFANQTLD
jgi:hypothetical protein